MITKQTGSKTLIVIVFLSALLSSRFGFSINSIQLSFEQLIMTHLENESSASGSNTQPGVVSNSEFFKQLKLDKLRVVLDLMADPVKLTMDLSHIDLPQPYKNITNLNISCAELLVENNIVDCQQGRISFNGLFTSVFTDTNFSLTYNVANNALKLNIKNMKLGRGNIALQLQLDERQWQARLQVSNVQFKYLKPYLQHYIFANASHNRELIDNTFGTLNFSAKASGVLASQANNDAAWLQSVHLAGRVKNVQYQYDDNMAEKLSLRIQADLSQTAKKTSPVQASGVYHLAVKINDLNGEIFQNGLYIIPTGKEKITTALRYYEKSQFINLSKFNIGSKNIFDFSASGQFALNAQDALKKLDAQINFTNLSQFNQLYVNNIVSDTDYEGLEFDGRFKETIQKKRDKISLNAQFHDFSTKFNEQFSLIDLNGNFYWNNHEQNKTPVAMSQLSWQELILNQLPLSKVKLNFSTHHDTLKLKKEVDIPLFDGALHINSLEVSQMLAQLPDTYKIKDKSSKSNKQGSHNDGFTLTIDGFIKPVSLALISSHFNWPELDGSLSAVIPSTTYNEKFLKVGGALMLQVFDGTIIVKDLQILEPLKDYAQLSANIDLMNLNLQSLTKTYNFGEIQGRVEGKFSQLELSSWQPVAFDGYIRTPENDKSSHKISQRAIDNLSSLGGASGILSRSFLSFFETFRYDKIGISCKLKNNICRMSGVEPKGDSYYIVKGGGIPRIDVMGFQKQVNWQVLVSRLKAIQQANEAVIE